MVFKKSHLTGGFSAYLFKKNNAAKITSNAIPFFTLSFSLKNTTPVTVTATMVPTLQAGYTKTAGSFPSACNKNLAE